MAIFQVGLGADDYEWLPDALRLESQGDITETGQALFKYTNDRGDLVTVTGADFAYSGGRPSGGTIATIVVTRGAETVMTLTGLNDPLKDFADRLLDDNDPTGAASELFDGDDQFNGSAETDTIGGFSRGDDSVDGGDGSDWIAGDEGDDELDGGNDDGFDIVSYSQTYFDKSAKKGIVLNVAKGSLTDPWGDKDTFSNFEGFWGSRFDDKFIGTGGQEEFAPLGGNDNINGKGGWDRIDYSHDNDQGKNNQKGITADFLKGKVKDGYGNTDTIKGIEEIRGTQYKDVFKGGNKNDAFEGLDGKDKFDGGKGFDRIEFYSNNFNNGENGVVVDVSKGKILDDGYGNVEKIKSIESFEGTDFGDTFIGSKGDDEFKGEDGNDTMSGGDGADRFVFNVAPDNATNHDVITDFSQDDGDIITLWVPGFPEINEVDGELDPAQFVANAGGNPTNGDQRIVYDTSTGKLFLDPDGNGSSGDQILIVTLTDKPTITIDAFDIWT